MNKKVYVSPTMLERNVRVSLICASPSMDTIENKMKPVVEEDIFNQGRDLLDHNGIGANNEIWDNKID